MPCVIGEKNRLCLTRLVEISDVDTRNTLCVVCRQRSCHDLQHQVDHLNNVLESVSSEQHKSDQHRRGLMEQLDSVTEDHQRLIAAHSELQRQREMMEEEKSDVDKDVERLQKDSDRWYMSAVCFHCNWCDTCLWFFVFYRSYIALIIFSLFYHISHHFQALNSLMCADVPLRNYSLTHFPPLSIHFLFFCSFFTFPFSHWL